jgi:hypothetical protein
LQVYLRARTQPMNPTHRCMFPGESTCYFGLN